MKPFAQITITALFTGLLIFSSGCEDDKKYNHNPPEGQGSLIIDNNTEDDIYIYIDGHLSTHAPYSSKQAYDLEPGEHRVVFDQRGGDRYYSDDVDILENKLTIWDVYFSARDYEVNKWID